MLVAGGGAGVLVATGGAGDVLSGMIGTFLAQGIDPWWAAGWGVYLHGLSADRIVAGTGQRSVTPSEVADGLAALWKDVTRDS